jgi:hypothetical protein
MLRCTDVHERIDTSTKGAVVLKPTLAVKIACAVLGAFALTGGGIALAAQVNSTPTFGEPATTTSAQPTGTPDDQQGQQGQQDQQNQSGQSGGNDQTGSQAQDPQCQSSEPDDPRSPEPTATADARDDAEHGEDCDHDAGPVGPSDDGQQGASHGADATNGNDQQVQSGNRGQGAPDIAGR